MARAPLLIEVDSADKMNKTRLLEAVLFRLALALLTLMELLAMDMELLLDICMDADTAVYIKSPPTIRPFAIFSLSKTEIALPFEI